MSIIKEKLLCLRQLCYKNLYLFAAFAIPALLMFLAYMTFNVQPFGERSVLALDLNGQYVYYYDYIYDVLHSGESLLYSWSRNLSGEFMGIIGYYLASPFNIIVWLFPREMITDGLMCMILAKIGACGSFFALYLHKSKGTAKTTALIFAPMYALCSYMVVQTMNPMWLDGVLILPLVCYGIESLVRENRFRMLTGALIYAFVTNFYIGFMIAIFTVLYYISFYFGNAKYDNTNALIAGFLKKGCLAALSGITAALSSCFMILPVYNSLQNGKFAFTEPDYSFVNNFELSDIFSRLFVNTYDTVRMEGLPFIYCGTLAIVLAALYFFCRRFSLAQRLSGGFLLAALLVSMYIRPLDMLWHGGQMPNWLPYRYSFMVSLLVVTMAAQMFEKLASVRAKSIGAAALFYVGLVIWAESSDTFIEQLGDSGREVFDGVAVALPAILLVVVAAIVVLLARKHLKKNKVFSSVAVLLVLSVVVGEATFNASTSLYKMHKDIVFSTKASYIDYIVPLRETVEKIKADDDGFYRIEKNFFRTVNDPMAANMYGLSHSSSTLNAKAIDMLGYFGFTSNGHYSRFSGNTPLTCDIFGVKYILDTPSNSDYDVTNGEEITVTENPDALPIAYLTDMSVLDVELENQEVFGNQNRLLAAMTGNTGDFYFKRFYETEGPIAENCTKGNFADGHVGFTDPGSSASVTYILHAIQDGEVYMYLPTDYQREVSVYVNGSYIGACFESDNYNIKHLGYFAKGDEITVRLDLNRSDLYYKTPQFVVYDGEAEKSAIEALAEMNSETVVEKISNTNIRITVNADKERLLFTTIPDEKGWEVYVDGVPTEYKAVMNEALIAIPVSAGGHVVEMKFTPAGLKLGVILTLVGIVVFVLMTIVWIMIKKPVRLKIGGKSEKAELSDGQANDLKGEENDISG